MSVIGPRPGLWNQDILTAERDKYGANDVKPGLTGWAQINGRDELEIPDKAKLDGDYVQNMGLKMDAKCFLGSVHVFGKDLIYLCSFYDDYGYKLLLLNKKNKIQCPVVVASMGVFAEAALKQKSAKKRIFISLCKFLGLFKNITWSVTSELEAKDVKKAMGNNIDYIVAEDLPRLSIPGKTKKEYSGILKVVFLSRICAHKNLDFAIRALNKMKEPVEFTIYGPIQEMEYWEKCEELLKNVRFSWTYGGDVPSEQVQKTLADYDVLIFPSKSENYGHVIFEALSVGCIPVISDKTPWNELNNKKAGYELPLDESIFTNTLDDFANLSVQEKEKLENNAIQYANEKLTTSLKETGYRKIFG